MTAGDWVFAAVMAVMLVGYAREAAPQVYMTRECSRSVSLFWRGEF
jgi:hypothetical protein